MSCVYAGTRVTILLLGSTKPSDTSHDKKNNFVLQRFIQYLASRNTLFNLSNFLDKSGSHGKLMHIYNFNKILDKILLIYPFIHKMQIIQKRATETFL